MVASYGCLYLPEPLPSIIPTHYSHQATLDRLEEAVYHLTLNLSSMTTQTLEMTTKTLEMIVKLDVILDRLSALILTPFPPNSSPTDAPPPVETLTTPTTSPSFPKPQPTTTPTLAPPPLAVSHHPELKTVAPMALLSLLRFHSTNHHIQLSRPLPPSLRTAHCHYRHGHCHEIPYDNDTILLGDAVVKHQIHPRLIWILFSAKTWFCSICHQRRRSPPHLPPHPPPPPKPPPPPSSPPPVFNAFLDCSTVWVTNPILSLEVQFCGTSHTHYLFIQTLLLLGPN
ncbi:hypothetical protein JHK82_012686 [Glycine max]|nr:hypothetical protein JHK86_012705 [Glycine max]KAG5154717.1 hypothetical protein JHK82_012686 [Glycine max]